MRKAIIFDFDGVIVEPETSGFKLIRIMLLDDFGIVVPKSLFQHKVGKPTVSFLKRFFGDKHTDNRIETIYRKI